MTFLGQENTGGEGAPGKWRAYGLLAGHTFTTSQVRKGR
jgi:hypothetical protein